MIRLSTFLVALILGSFPAFAQETDFGLKPKSNALKLVPQQFLAKTFQLDWEHAVGPKTSLQFSPSITAGTNVLDNDYHEVTGGGLEITGKFYVGTRHNPIEGFYAGLSGSYHRYKMEDPEFVQFDQFGNEIMVAGQTADLNRYSTNVTFGYQFYIQNIVALDLYAGGGMRIGDYTDQTDPEMDRFNTTGIFNFAYTGVAPKVGFSVGILF